MEALIIGIAVIFIAAYLNKSPIFKKEVKIIMLEDEKIEVNQEKNIITKWLLTLLTILLIIILLNQYDVTPTTRFEITTASTERLMTIDGIGRDKADSICSYIQTNGLEYYDELLKLEGIGEETINKLKRYTTLDKTMFGR